MEILHVKASDEDKGQRLDKVLARLCPDLSRARVQSLVDGGFVTSDGKTVTNSQKIKGDESFDIQLPPAEDGDPQPQEIALDIVYEDKDLLVLNKAAGMVVHPAAGNYDGTLVNALLAHCGDSLSGIGGVKRPGIVHRLDKETSGLMVVAKNDIAHHGLSEQLSSRALTRVYKAVVWGCVTPSSGTIETQMGRSKSNRKKMTVLSAGGKEAVTNYKLQAAFGMLASLVECRLKTGRTHQIRVHMAHIKHWMVGDPVYGKASIEKFLRLHKAEPKLAEALTRFPRQALHAAELEFIHPISKNKMSFKADLPQDMKSLIKALEKYSKTSNSLQV